jgi:cytoskeletal protein CcmA (bactofilin family)
MNAASPAYPTEDPGSVAPVITPSEPTAPLGPVPSILRVATVREAPVLQPPVSLTKADHSRGRIPAGVSFKGTITGTSSYIVQGSFEGTIALDGADPVVDGKIEAQNATIAGRVKGEIDCQKGCVTFGPTAQCSASLTYEQIVVERGAKLNAQLRTAGA